MTTPCLLSPHLARVSKRGTLRGSCIRLLFTTLNMAMNFVTFNQDYSYLAVGESSLLFIMGIRV